MQIKERESNAARALFLEKGMPAHLLIEFADRGESLVQGLAAWPDDDWTFTTIGQELHNRGLPQIGAVFGNHLPAKASAGIIKAMGQQESRDSAEADAAQKLFVDFGFTAAFLMNSQRLNSNTRRSWALRPSQMPMWDTGSCGGGKTAAHIGSLVHNEVYELLRADKTHQLKEQALVARAAYKLGQLSACMTTSGDRKECKSAIKRNLVQGLVDAGVRLGDVQTIMNNMLKELNNV